MKAHNIELAILTAVARVRGDEWLPWSLGVLQNRLREVDPDTANASGKSIAEAAIYLNQESHLLLGKREDGARRVLFDLQKQLDEGYVANFFYRGGFELKLTHQGRKHLEENQPDTLRAEPRETEVAAPANVQVVNPGRRPQAVATAPNETLGEPVKATILNVLIASPSDVRTERDAVESAIHEWNANHHAEKGIILLPVRWETHSYPGSGDRPQGILNKQIVDSGHLLIGIFGNRLGTPTGKARSGTIEEIEEFRKTGRYVALYFSGAPIPRDADRDQLDALEQYKKQRQQDTLYSTFNTAEELRRLVTQHLPKIVPKVYQRVRVRPATPIQTPSFLFVLGVPLGDNDSAQWLMMLRHYGPNPAYNCDITFYDNDRKNLEHEWLVRNPDSPYPPPGLVGESQRSIHIAEAGPEGSAGSFKWNPLDPNRQHYTVSISCRDGVFEQKLEVTRVDGFLRSSIMIQRGQRWIEKNAHLSPLVFRYEDPQFVRTPLATEMPKERKGKIVHPGWKPLHRSEVPTAIIDPNGNIQIISGITLPDGSVQTEFGSWNLLTKHLGDDTP
jgi:hypothetical protein